MRKITPFPKRTYNSPRALASDISALLSGHQQIRKTISSGMISPAFRERLMLIVTQVNNCRYCSRFHTAEASKVGVSEKDIQVIKTGGIPEDVPASEIVALQYARHWAEQDAQPDPGQEAMLEKVYGKEIAQMIQILLRMIRIGNLTGNTLDSWLYRLTFGRYGLPAAD